MGCKEIASAQVKQNSLLNVKDKNLNFIAYRETAQTQTPKAYEIKIKIFEMTTQSNGTKIKRLLSKYLYFKADGSFQSLISNTQKNESYTITGHLTSSKEIQFTKKKGDEVFEYKGVINSIENGRELNVEGKIVNKGIEVPYASFSFEFPKLIWAVEYTLKGGKVAFPIYMNFKKSVFNGISFDDTGISLWIGVEKEQKKVKIVQRYIKEDNKEERCFVFEGTSDKIQGIKIKGNVKNEAFGVNSPFTLKLIANRTHSGIQDD